jgi:hypothetical protein
MTISPYGIAKLDKEVAAIFNDITKKKLVTRTVMLMSANMAAMTSQRIFVKI